MQPREFKDYLDWIFYINSEDGLIHSGVLFISICDPNVNKVILINLQKVFIQGFQAWKDFVIAWNLIFSHEVLQNQVLYWPAVNHSLDFKHDSAKENVNQNENVL